MSEPTIRVSMSIIRDAMSEYTGDVPLRLFYSDDPKHEIIWWLFNKGIESEVDYDNIIVDGFDYDRDKTKGIDLKGDY